MFFRIFALFAVLAVAFASPKPEPQVLAYSSPGVLPALGYNAYNPIAYSSPYAGVPYAYSGYYVR